MLLDQQLLMVITDFNYQGFLKLINGINFKMLIIYGDPDDERKWSQ